MTASLPKPVCEVFDRFITTEYTTVDKRGQPITWPVTPYHHRDEGCIDVTTGLGYPKKAYDAKANPKVALLFSDPTGSGLDDPPMVLVQGIADFDDRDLDANRKRYWQESGEKLPATKDMQPPKFMRGMFSWYYTRIYVHVRPERVYVWPNGDVSAEPELLDSHMEEVRSAHAEEPTVALDPPEGGAPTWDGRMDELGDRYPTGVLSIVAPDGFPFSVRVPIEVNAAEREVRFGAGAVGVPVHPGRACLTVHDHGPNFEWQRNFQVRGDLIERGDEWVLVPHRLVGGFELPPGSMLARSRLNFAKMRRYRKIAKRELARR
ncbi:MAG TPA: pyridoxamine 5'-phosphate oxidase family protein [Thermoleophilaceae bacterium]|nr:pyridoxamine 5'-phosphate oxidase family protein [Thermoleophilaceae bacterium]